MLVVLAIFMMLLGGPNASFYDGGSGAPFYGASLTGAPAGTASDVGSGGPSVTVPITTPDVGSGGPSINAPTPPAGDVGSGGPSITEFH